MRALIEALAVPAPVHQSHFNGNGERVVRKSSDSAWPLRRANGLTYAESKERR